MEKLQNSIQFIKGVGPVRYQQLNRLEIETVFDMMWHMPQIGRASCRERV